MTTPTADEVRAWPVTVDLPTAGRCFGIGRDASYRLAAGGDFPVPVLRVGRRLVVVRAALLAKLGIDPSSHTSETAENPDGATVPERAQAG